MSKNKGITLIALVITIIIMLILVGVVIHELGSDNGIIAKARWAEFVTEYERVDEAKELYAAGKMIDRYDDEAKFTLKSLFTNVSYAEEKSDMLYPVDLNQRFYISEAVNTLRNTICEVECLKEYDLTDPERVDLYKVDFGLLNDIEVKREYVINIVSGMLYYIDGEPYRDRVYHTLRYGAPKELNEPDDEPEPDDTDLEADDPDLKIHYLSGFDDKEYTQKVKQSKSSAVALNPVEFRKSNYNFLYWKDVTVEKAEVDDKREDENPSDFEHKTGGYYDVVNQLVSILDEAWETDIIEIIEENENYESDLDDYEADPDEDDTIDPEEIMDAITVTKNEILDYLNDYQADIQAMLGLDMSMDGLAGWLIENTSYLSQLEEYELENWSEEPKESDDEVQEDDYDIYNDREVVNMGQEDMWLEAVWTEGFITLDANGGTYKGKETVKIGVKEGEKYGTALNTAPSKENYIFAGWFTEIAGGTQKVSIDIFNETDLPDRILYAHWVEMTSPEIVTLTYDANGGIMKDSKKKTVESITENRVKGTKIATFPNVQPEKSKKDYWFFVGWFTSPTGGVEVNESTIINQSMTVYPQWTDEPNVNIVLNGGEIFHRYTNEKYIEERYNQWNPVKYYDGIDNSKIYAINGEKIPKQAKGCQLPITGIYSRGIRKVRVVKTPTGKDYKVRSTFKGWFTGPDGTGILVRKYGVNKKYYKDYGDTLYAYWRERYIIKYDANGGQFGSKASNTWKQKYVYEGKKYLGCNRPKKAGYRFLGWYDSPEGGNKVELKNNAYTVKEDTTLYAHWEKVEFTFEVSNITDRGWTQKLTPISDLSGYSIYYKCSLSPKGTSGAKVYTYSKKKETLTNKKEGMTYYVWAVVSRYGDKIYSDVKEVTIQYAPMEFKVNVSSITKNSWKQAVSNTIGSISKYDVTYYVSTVNQNSTASSTTQTKKVTSGSTRSSSMTGQTEGKRYYVWAVATHKENSSREIKSKNYIILNTSHTHYGNPSKQEGCYRGGGRTCPASGNYIKYVGTSNFSYVTHTSSRKCALCGTSISSKTYHYQGDRDFIGVMCLDCGAKADHWYKNSESTVEHSRICTYCYSRLTSKYIDMGYVNFKVLSSSTKDLWHTTGKCTSKSHAYMVHTYTYSLNCGISEQSASSSSFNF